MSRVRHGGTVQRGACAGVRFTYDRIQRCSLYWGGEIFSGGGRLEGHNSRNLTLKSNITDTLGEGRIGFTFMQREPRSPFISPFLGYGSFSEKNSFVDPSPMLITFHESYNYVVAGFLSGVNFTPLLSMGINFKVQFMVNGKSEVRDDPIFEEIHLNFKKEINARVEVPIIYRLKICNLPASLYAAPFYEFRHFGGQQGFPFDYLDTKFHLIGARIALGLAF